MTTEKKMRKRKSTKLNHFDWRKKEKKAQKGRKKGKESSECTQTHTRSERHCKNPSSGWQKLEKGENISKEEVVQRVCSVQFAVCAM